jgi:phosphopantetheine adenylyltransferase
MGEKKMVKAMYPGTFDPITYGHIDAEQLQKKHTFQFKRKV